MVEVDVGEIQRGDAITQEPAPTEVISEVTMQAVQDVQIGASDDKVWTQLPKNFVNWDSDNEDHIENEGIQRTTKELSILRIEVRKWRIQVERFQEGMVSLPEHRNTIKELKERWAEELMF